MTLTFVPKLVSMGLIVLFSGRWMIRTMVTWVEALWSMIPSI
jgi:flagellar biosynthesis protein FliQ